MEHESQVITDEIFDDGARRARTQVQYDDGLSEDQWLLVRPVPPPMTNDQRIHRYYVQALEEEDDDQENGKKRAKRGAPGVPARGKRLDSPGSDAGGSTGGRRRGVILDSDDEEPTKKRKRGRQSQAASVTPSINGDEEDAPKGGVSLYPSLARPQTLRLV